MSLSVSIMRSIADHLKTIEWEGRPLNVYVGDPPRGSTPPYAFIWGAPSVPTAETMCPTPDTLDRTVNIQVVAQTHANTLALADEVMGAAGRCVPRASGWAFARCRVVEAREVQSERVGESIGTAMNPSWTTVVVQVHASKG